MRSLQPFSRLVRYRQGAIQALRISALLCSLAILLGASSLHAQEPSGDTLRGLVQQYLITQLGYDPTLLEFSYSGRTWEDSSLGCPVEGQPYTEGQQAGYQWLFLMGDGVRYSLHTDLSAQQIVLCAATSELTFTYSTYTGSYFTLNHPNLWSAQTANQTEVAFLWRGQATCSLPESRVFVLANLTDAASILDSYTSTIGLPPDRNRYSPFLNLGLSIQHQANCGGILRQVRATGVAAGNNTAYLILQSAPANVFAIWSPVFEEMLTSFAPSANPLTGTGANLSSLVGSAAPTATPTIDTANQITATSIAPTPAPVSAITVPTLLPTFTPTVAPTGPNPPPIVIEVDLTTYPLAHVFLGEVHIGALNNLPGARIQHKVGERTHLRTSQDGFQLAFIENDTILKTVSLLAPVDDNTLAEDAFGDFPPAWAFDQPALAYLAATSEADETGDIPLEIHTIHPDNTRATFGPLTYRDDCQTDSDYAIDQLWHSETGGNILFEWLPTGQFLYSIACDGVGIALFDPSTSQSTPLGEGITHAILSPNRQLLAGIDSTGQLLVFDLTTLQLRPITTSTSPDQLGWDITSTQLFYSTRFPNDSLIFEDATLREQALTILGSFPYESRLNTLRILQVDINNGFEVPLWEGTGFGIGMMRGLPDGNGLLFTLIPSDRTWLTNFINNVPANVLRNSQPETELYYLPSVNTAQPQAGGARLLALTGQPAIGRPPLPQ